MGRPVIWGPLATLEVLGILIRGPIPDSGEIKALKGITPQVIQIQGAGVMVQEAVGIYAPSSAKNLFLTVVAVEAVPAALHSALALKIRAPRPESAIAAVVAVAVQEETVPDVAVQIAQTLI